ncbi:hypothetical protein CHS0354_015182 [Potamilus streckersoni]|uniref:Arrestin C-terminal-like domain-containing protein n=1 Tax=Potamilus streckersoni TaxID=2493646 RepID=A0AAE0SD36_9BIVA|nr:hypothetical protein CHS0354_015182 [Potamilus streckersoni]
MPAVQNIALSLTGDREAYHPGDIVCGVWIVDIVEPLTIRGIRLSIHGAAYTKWSGGYKNREDYIGYETFVGMMTTVFGKKVNESGPDVTLPVGRHTYTFQFLLPSGPLPSSFEGYYGSIRYWLKLEIDRPLFRFNVRRFKPITVLDKIDINATYFQNPCQAETCAKISKLLGLGDSGTVTLSAKTNRNAYCPGELIMLNLLANNQSLKDLGAVKATLIQRVQYMANGETKYRDTVISSVSGKDLKKGENRVWRNQPLHTMAIPPTTMPRTCQIIVVSYFVNVCLEVPFLSGGDVILHLPITIGSVPQGQPKPQTAHCATQNFEIDASSALTYTKCNKGFSIFTHGDQSRFPNLQYTPMCTYVPNYKYKPHGIPAQEGPNPIKSVQGQGPSKVAQLLGRSENRKEVLTLPQPQVSTMVLPSAPPLHYSGDGSDEPPPSYEDAVSPYQEEDVKDKEDEENEDAHSACANVLMRFSDEALKQFRLKVRSQMDALRIHNGTLLGLAPQVIVQNGSWLPRTAVAVFTFPDTDNAKNWFSEFSSASDFQELQLYDAILGTSPEQVQCEKPVFSLMVMKLNKASRTDVHLKEVNKLAPAASRIRKAHGGVAVMTRMKQLECLFGTWDPEDGVTATQWTSMAVREKYKAALSSDKGYEKFRKLFLKTYQVKAVVTIQSEDLSYYQEMNEDNESVCDGGNDVDNLSFSVNVPEYDMVKSSGEETSSEQELAT